MEQIKFTKQQIDRFNDMIENCLENSQCRKIFEGYLKEYNKRVDLDVLRLWVKANDTDVYDEETFFDLIDEVDSINADDLQTMSNSDKLKNIKMKCCIILEKQHRDFIDYLSDNNKF